jgi:hypothetical protein
MRRARLLFAFAVLLVPGIFVSQTQFGSRPMAISAAGPSILGSPVSLQDGGPGPQRELESSAGGRAFERKSVHASPQLRVAAHQGACLGRLPASLVRDNGKFDFQRNRVHLKGKRTTDRYEEGEL